MAFVELHPERRSWLTGLGLDTAEQFLALPGLIVSGHSDRHVARVTLGHGRQAICAYLKREHLVRWHDRIVSYFDGWGWSSRCLREQRTLQAVAAAGIECPQWLAVGEDDHGRAFLLLAEMPDSVDLRLYLRDRRPTAAARYHFARHLGTAVGRLHAAGFTHCELYAKHVLVDPLDQSIAFIDWQRTRRRASMPWRLRRRDLAALDATLADDLATPGERIACLRGYLQTLGERADCDARFWRLLVQDLRQHGQRLLERRHVREVRNGLPPSPEQGVYWLDGEALCVTSDYWAETAGRTPDWLLQAHQRWQKTAAGEVSLAHGRRALFVRRRYTQPLRWLWARLRGRQLVAPEMRQAGAMFQRQRLGASGPRLLAFGQRHPWPWRTESFLLTELPEGPA
jgi:tRNA A-37 threonylcarbamoyl transferase component Bud32